MFIAFRDTGEGRTWRIRERKQVFNSGSNVRQCIYISAASYILNRGGNTGVKGFSTPKSELPYRGTAHGDNPTSGLYWDTRFQNEALQPVPEASLLLFCTSHS